jgi:hypothetical protein
MIYPWSRDQDTFFVDRRWRFSYWSLVYRSFGNWGFIDSYSRCFVDNWGLVNDWRWSFVNEWGWGFINN